MTSPILFPNQYKIMDERFYNMIDKLEAVREKTDDYELIKMSKHILGKDYYKDAKLWLKRCGNHKWWRDDLI